MEYVRLLLTITLIQTISQESKTIVSREMHHAFPSACFFANRGKSGPMTFRYSEYGGKNLYANPLNSLHYDGMEHCLK